MPDTLAQFIQLAPLFQHFLTNALIGGPVGAGRPDWMQLPDGTNIQTATPGQQDTVTYWLEGWQGEWHYATQAQAFVQDLFAHYATGSALHLLPGAGEQFLQLYTEPTHLTTSDLMFAVHTLPDGLGDALVNRFGEQAIVDYAMHEAPGIVVVGTAPADVAGA
jgi:hypothetical protein